MAIYLITLCSVPSMGRGGGGWSKRGEELTHHTESGGSWRASLLHPPPPCLLAATTAAKKHHCNIRQGRTSKNPKKKKHGWSGDRGRNPGESVGENPRWQVPTCGCGDGMSRLAAGEAAVEWSGLGEVEEVDNEPKFGSRLGSSKLVENVPGGWAHLSVRPPARGENSSPSPSPSPPSAARPAAVARRCRSSSSASTSPSPIDHDASFPPSLDFFYFFNFINF